MKEFLRSIFRQPLPPYPGLKYRSENGKEFWEGVLRFDCRYDSIRRKDEFEVQIEMPQKDAFPLARETGGRIEKIQTKRRVKKKIDLHINPGNDSICLCPKPEERRLFPDGVDLEKFIKDLVIPYFFALGHFEETGKWPWGYYSHGPAGIFEYYFDKRGNDPNLLNDCLAAIGVITQEQKRKLIAAQWNGREKCICGSGLQLRKCHRKAFKGLKAILEDLRSV